jgi:hypothetical protein
MKRVSPEQLDQIFPERSALIAASGIERDPDDTFIPIDLLLNMTHEQMDAIFPSWQQVSTEIRRIGFEVGSTALEGEQAQHEAC